MLWYLLAHPGSAPSLSRGGALPYVRVVTETQNQIPMPGLLADKNAPFSDSDPATSHEGGPTPGRGERDPSDAAIDDPVTMYGRQLWTELDKVASYLQIGRASCRERV